MNFAFNLIEKNFKIFFLMLILKMKKNDFLNNWSIMRYEGVS